MNLRAAVLKLKDFAGLAELEIVFGKERTRIVAANGMGKTRVMTALWALFAGIAETNTGNVVGKKASFITAGAKSADIELILVDGEHEIACKRHLTKSLNKITFDAPDGYEVSAEWLKNLIKTELLNPTIFCAMTGKEQALSVGVDVSGFQERRKELKADFTILGRELKKIGEPVEAPEVGGVSTVELTAKYTKAVEANAAIDKATTDKIALVKEVADLQTEIIQLNKVIEQARLDIELKGKASEAKIDEAAIIEGKIVAKADTESLANDIAEADKTNAAALLYETFVEARAKKKEKQTEIDNNKSAQASIDTDQVQYLKGFDFPFKEMSVDDEGGLLIEGREVKANQWSLSELIGIVARLYIRQPSALRIIWIDNFEAFDDIQGPKLLRSLIEMGFQVVTAEVKTGAKKVEGDNVVYLGEEEVVD